jgi:hypothetical protein
MAETVMRYGEAAFNVFKRISSSFYGLTTFLAAISSSPSHDSSLHISHDQYDGKQTAAQRNGNYLAKKEAFISSLVANMTVPELGKPPRHDLSPKRQILF